MATPQDSIQYHIENNAYVSSVGDSATRAFKPRHPYQVLRMLPKDATPEQQDSAIQANFQPDPIHYSQCPDTLHLPGHKAPKQMKWKDVPVYYKETFFSNDTMFQAEYTGVQNGVAGVAIPYSMRTDPYITIMLLACIIISTVLVSRLRSFVARRSKVILNTVSGHNEKETSNEIQAQMVLNVMGAMLMSFFLFSYVQHFVSDTYMLDTQYHLMGIFLVLLLGYKLLKLICYFIVNNVFWNGKHNLQYVYARLFIGCIESVSLLLVVLVRIYFELNIISTTFCVIFVLAIAKLLSFYKCYVIFFKQKGGFFHFFLYLCTLEIIPLAVLGTTVLMAANILKVNF